MPRFVLGPNANRSASDVARKAQAKTLYAANLTKQAVINAGCVLQMPNVGPATNMPASVPISVAQGAQDTTVQEQIQILANAVCQQ